MTIIFQETAGRFSTTRGTTSGLALHNYHDVYRHFPASVMAAQRQGPANCGSSNGNVFIGSSHSWRVSILPFLEQVNLYNTFNISGQMYCGGGWGAVTPSVLSATPVPGYLCPSDPTSSGDVLSWTNMGGNITSNASNYGALASVYGVNYEKEIASIGGGLNGTPAQASFGKKSSVGYGGLPTMPLKIVSYVDGTSNTAVVAEMFRGKTTDWGGHCPNYTGTPSLEYFTLNATSGPQTIFDGNYCNVGDAYIAPSSGTVSGGPQDNRYRCGLWAVENGIGCTLDAIRTPNHRKPDHVNGGPTQTGQYLNSDQCVPASSAHAGGALTVFADGSVHFISDSVDIRSWRATVSYDGIGTLAGGETARPFSDL